MTPTKYVQEWMAKLPTGSLVGIDDGGLTLIAYRACGRPTGAYYEVGGVATPPPPCEKRTGGKGVKRAKRK